MNQFVKAGIVFCLLILGIAAALAFRKPPEEKTADAERPEAVSQENLGPTPGLRREPAADAKPTSSSTADVVQSPPARAEDQYKPPRPSTLDVPPPAMSAFYPQTGQPALVPLPSVDGTAGSTNPAPAAAMVDLIDRDEPRQVRRHAIRDGDTLADLAVRFLGDRKHAQEIFAANRDVLDDPDVLPIGLAISIPLQAAVSMTESESDNVVRSNRVPSPSADDAGGATSFSSAENVKTAGPLVPVESSR